MRLRALAPGKVNLSLFLGGRRPDGRHRLVTVFQSVSLADALELEVLDGGGDVVVCPGVEGENLAQLALAALRERGWSGPPVRVTIDKRIPIAAGMAGGSADAAATLRLAMAIAPGRAEEVEQIAARLGSDVPSQLLAGVALGTGAGEVVERFEPLSRHAFVVLPSPYELSAAAVFGEADRLGLARADDQLEARYDRLAAALAAGESLPGELLVNDLQGAAVALCPWSGEALEAVLAAGAEHALVSGSGPTVVGLWWGERCAQRAAAAAERLRGTHPQAVVAEPVTAAFAAPALT